MARSVKKGPYIHPSLTKKVDAMNARSEKKVIKTWSRSSTVLCSPRSTSVGGTIVRSHAHQSTSPVERHVLTLGCHFQTRAPSGQRQVVPSDTASRLPHTPSETAIICPAVAARG